MMNLSINFSKQLLLRATLVLLVGIGAWMISPEQLGHSSPAKQALDVPRFDDKNCKEIFPDFLWNGVKQNRFRCGYLLTWENYDSQAGAVQLAVMVAHPDPKLTRKPDSVIWLAGGPGDVGIILPKPRNRAPDQALVFADLFQRDFIQFSQRGSKYSQPDFDCSQYRAIVLENFVLENSDKGENSWNWEKWNKDLSAALRFCLDQFKGDNAFIDIHNFNSQSNARDVITLFHTLEIERVNLYGGSYGTLLAQHILASSPSDIRSVVLDGVAPMGVDWVADYPSNMQRSLDEIFKSCERDPVCKKAYPDLEPFFYEVLDRLRKQPVRISVKDDYYEIDTVTNERKELSTTYQNVYLDDYGFLTAIGDLLKDSGQIGEIPRIIYAAGNGHFGDIGNVYYSGGRSQDFAWGVYYSIYCAEFARFKPSNTDLSQVKPPLRVLYTASGQFIKEVCQDFGQDGKPYGEASITDKQVSVLIFNGKFDPVTPPEYGAQVAKRLSISPEFNLTSDISAHGSSFSSTANYDKCVKNIIKNFFDHPDQPPDEQPCWKEMQLENQTIQFNTRNPEVYIHSLGLKWEEQQQNLQTWWEEQQQKTKDSFDQWWQEQQKKLEDAFNQWWQDVQKRLEQWFEQQLTQWLNQCLPSALLPLGLVAGVVIARHRKKH